METAWLSQQPEGKVAAIEAALRISELCSASSPRGFSKTEIVQMHFKICKMLGAISGQSVLRDELGL